MIFVHLELILTKMVPHLLNLFFSKKIKQHVHQHLMVFCKQKIIPGSFWKQPNPNLPAVFQIAGGRCEDSEPRRGRLGGGAVSSRGALWLRWRPRPFRQGRFTRFTRKIPWPKLQEVPNKRELFVLQKKGAKARWVFGWRWLVLILFFKKISCTKNGLIVNDDDILLLHVVIYIELYNGSIPSPTHANIHQLLKVQSIVCRGCTSKFTMYLSSLIPP